MATLHVAASNDPQLQGRAWDLGNELRIGRDPANDVLVADSRVSRRHARIVSSAEGFVISDEGSGNGVWVNQQRVTRHVLADGDVFAIGDTQFRFEDPLARATIVTPLPPPPPAAAVAPPPVAPVAPAPVAPVAPVAAAGSYAAPAPAPTPAPAAGYAPVPQPQPQPPKRTSGCAIGCLIFSILLFLGTIAGSLFALYRAGYLPGFH